MTVRKVTIMYSISEKSKMIKHKRIITPGGYDARPDEGTLQGGDIKE